MIKRWIFVKKKINSFLHGKKRQRLQIYSLLIYNTIDWNFTAWKWSQRKVKFNREQSIHFVVCKLRFVRFSIAVLLRIIPVWMPKCASAKRKFITCWHRSTAYWPAFEVILWLIVGIHTLCIIYASQLTWRLLYPFKIAIYLSSTKNPFNNCTTTPSVTGHALLCNSNFILSNICAILHSKFQMALSFRWLWLYIIFTLTSPI